MTIILMILINGKFQSTCIRKCKGWTHSYVYVCAVKKDIIMLLIINVWKLSFILSIVALSSISFH